MTMSDDSILGADVLELAVAAPGLPEGMRAWTAESARRALESLRSTKVAVLAIDVYDRVVWGFAPGEESWVCRRSPGERPLEFAHRSRSEALAWIGSFPRRDVLFGIEFGTQDVAADVRARRGDRIDRGATVRTSGS
jgi:hypothetical protein